MDLKHLPDPSGMRRVGGKCTGFAIKYPSVPNRR